jgi:hypothetical protein
MFLPIPIGGIIGVIIYLNYYSPKYSRAVDYYAPHPVPPEERLPMATLGGICFTVSLFWFGWTSYPSISVSDDHNFGTCIFEHTYQPTWRFSTVLGTINQWCITWFGYPTDLPGVV